jgi:hypothetical protein
MDKAFAQHFATDWIASWNARDIEKILSHYSDDFAMFSPLIIEVVGEPSGKLCGKHAVGTYWQNALTLIPDLQFKLISVLVGVETIALSYKGALGRLATEIFTSVQIIKSFVPLHTMPSSFVLLCY